MVKNTKGGKKARKARRAGLEDEKSSFVKEYANPSEYKVYARVEKRSGGNYLLCKIKNGVLVNCYIPGKMRGRRKIWMNRGDILLVQLMKEKEGSQRDTYEIILKYNDHQIQCLNDAPGSRNLDRFYFDEPGAVNTDGFDFMTSSGTREEEEIEENIGFNFEDL